MTGGAFHFGLFILIENEQLEKVPAIKAFELEYRHVKLPVSFFGAIKLQTYNPKKG